MRLLKADSLDSSRMKIGSVVLPPDLLGCKLRYRPFALQTNLNSAQAVFIIDFIQVNFSMVLFVIPISYVMRCHLPAKIPLDSCPPPLAMRQSHCLPSDKRAGKRRGGKATDVTMNYGRGRQGERWLRTQSHFMLSSRPKFRPIWCFYPLALKSLSRSSAFC